MLYKNFIPENLAFRLQCKECGYYIESGDYGIIESIVGISEHIESNDHVKFELEIYDFDLVFVKETRDIVKLFTNIDGSLKLSDITSMLKDRHEGIGEIIKNALQNDILCIDDIDDKDIYFALTDLGGNLWEICKKDKNINILKEKNVTKEERKYCKG